MKLLPIRQRLLLLALVASVGASYWVSQRDDEAVPAVTPARGAARPGPALATDWPRPASSPREAWPRVGNLALSAWGDAPQAPKVAAVPAVSEVAAPPAPPPFPYQWVGSLTDSRPRAVLNNAQRSAVVGVGDVVDGRWRIDAVEARALRITYLPLGTSLTIPFASA